VRTLGVAAAAGAIALTAVALGARDAEPAQAGGQTATALTAGDLRGIPASDRTITLASQRWLALTRAPVASLRSLSFAHPGTKSIRVNRTRAQLTGRNGRQRFPYPRRTVVVKTASVGGTVTLVAIMRRVTTGSDPAAWRYVEYKRGSGGGTFMKVGGGQSLCSSCHVSATDVQGSDAVFTRLAPR
jgi:hypothetical protein